MNSRLILLSLLLVSTVVADSLTVVVGQRVLIQVTADGTQPFTYQWYKNGVIIPGATQSTYTLASVTLTDGAAYSATVSNAIGSVESDNAYLTVKASSAPTTNGTTITVTVTGG